MKKILLYLIGCLVVTGGTWAGLQDGLVAYWPLEDNLQDVTGNGHDGTAFNATSISYVPGKVGQAAKFDGTAWGRGVGTGTWNPNVHNGPFTIACWARWNAVAGGSQWQGLVGKRDGWGDPDTTAQNNRRTYWYLEFDQTDNKVNSLYFQTGQNGPWQTTQVLLDDQWRYIVGTFNGSQGILYVDGQQVASDAMTLDERDFGVQFVFGCVENSGGNQFNGSMDEIAAWNRVLSTDEIAELYNNGDGKSLSGEKWQALYVAPANKATDIPLAGTTLQWTTSPEPAPKPIVRYDIYLGDNYANIAEPNILSRTATVGPAVFEYSTGGGLKDNTTYYWRIDTVVDDVNIAFGQVYSFQTVVMTPIITQQPQNVSVGPGGWPVSFTVVATTNDGAISYKWFKQGSATVLSTTDTLTTATPGLYYCELTNAFTTSPVVSDTVELSVGNGPWAVTGPDPDGSAWVNPQVDLTLKWQHAQYAPYNADYQVYFGEFGEALILKGTTNNFQFVLPKANLAYDKKYSWRVDTTYQGTTEAGPVWSFETIKLKPVIVTNPANVVVPDKGTATFTFDVESVSNVTYVWFKQESGLQVGTGNPLVLTNVSAASEGYYYSEATNSSGTTRSASASLMLEQLLAHWKMDETVLPADTGAIIKDSTVFMHDGTESGEVRSVTGKIGNAMAFDGTNDYIDTGTWNPNERSPQFTITLWANWAGLNEKYQGLIGKRDDWGAANMMWQLEANIDTGALGFAREGSYPPGVGALPIGQWAFVAVTFDGTNSTIYRDGLAAASGAFSLGSKTDAHLVIGGSDVNSGNFNGQLDDVRIYNYALDALEIAHLYQSGAGGTLCMGNPAHDLDGNCRVGLNDVAIFAAEWLKCNLVPLTACQ